MMLGRRMGKRHSWRAIVILTMDLGTGSKADSLVDRIGDSKPGYQNQAISMQGKSIGERIVSHSPSMWS